MSSSFRKELKTDADAYFSLADVTADDYSESLDLSEWEEIGIAVDTGTCTGTSATLDISPQWSPDGGTTWYTEWPIATGEIDGTPIGSAALDTLTQANDDEFHMAWWPNWCVRGCLVRFYFNVGGSSPVFPVKVYVMGRKRARFAV